MIVEENCIANIYQNHPLSLTYNIFGEMEDGWLGVGGK